MSGIVGDNLFRASGVVASSGSEYDDSQIQSNIAMLGFYVAVNGSLVRYNLVDQSIDEFYDTSGVDASASTNEARAASGSNFYYYGETTGSPTVTEDADTVTVDGDYTWYRWTTVGAGSYNNASTQDHQWLVVAGGGGGQGVSDGGAGAGAGGYRAGASLSLTGGTTYTATVGAGGAIDNDGDDSSLSGTGITTITSTGGGFGGDSTDRSGNPGGSGGGKYSSDAGSVGAGNTPAITPISGETTTVQGYAGSIGGTDAATYTAGGGGGGASEVGIPRSGTTAGIGGDGVANSITGSSVTYAGGGGGGINSPHTRGTGGAGGGGDGGNNSSSSTAGTNGLGGGGGGGYAKAGGSGVIILRRLTSTTTAGGDLTLQSTDVTAVTEPDYGEFVTLIENGEGTATLNTDIKGYLSRDSGTTFTQGTLVDEGSWGTNKKILGFHDLDISSQPSGTSMCYKITTHNQSAGSKETNIFATSIGWR